MFSVLSGFSGIEQSDTVQGNLLSSSVGSPLSLSPTAMSNPIMAIRFLITVALTNGTTAITSGTVGDFINQIKIRQGTVDLITLNGMRELQDFYHIKTGQVLSDVNIPTTASTIDSASLEFELPFRIALGSQVVVKSLFNGWSNAIVGGSVTAGTVSVALAFVYGNGTVATSEQWDVNQTSTALASSTDINLGQYLNTANPIYQLFIDATSDANLNYYDFYIGKTILYKAYPFDLTNFEVRQPQYSHVSGLFALPIVEGTVINTASNTQAKAVINLASSIQVTTFAQVN